jgi:hypothetical protein
LCQKRGNYGAENFAGARKTGNGKKNNENSNEKEVSHQPVYFLPQIHHELAALIGVLASG